MNHDEDEEFQTDEERLETYRALGVTQVRWVAALDSTTCPECLRLDGEVFQVDERLPHTHSACRCVVAPETGCSSSGARASEWGDVDSAASQIVVGSLLRMWDARARLVDDLMSYLKESGNSNSPLAANLVTDILSEVGAKPSKEATELILTHGTKRAYDHQGFESVVHASASFGLLNLLPGWLERLTTHGNPGPTCWLDASSALCHEAAAGTPGIRETRVACCQRAEHLAEGNCTELLKVARAYDFAGQRESALRVARVALEANSASKAAKKLIAKLEAARDG